MMIDNFVYKTYEAKTLGIPPPVWPDTPSEWLRGNPLTARTGNSVT